MRCLSGPLVASNVMNVLADYSSFIKAPHEYFDDPPITKHFAVTSYS